MKTAKYSIDFKITPIILLIFSYLLSIPAINAQEFKFTSKRKQQTISFESIKNLIIVPIYINDEGPFNFILDTGVNPLLITDPTLKQHLKTSYSRNVKISGYGNLEQLDATLTSTKVKLGDAEIENMPTIVLKEDVLNFSNVLGKKIHGLIGYHFFNSFIVKVNYNTKRLQFISPSKKTRRKGEKIKFELIENKPYINVNINQEGIGNAQLKVIVDCGASHAISLESLNNVPFPTPNISIDADLGAGLSGDIKGKVARIRYLKIGSFTFKDVVAGYPKYQLDSATNKDRNANLGAEILQRFNITYDYPNRLMYLKKNYKFTLPFEHDMSGIDFYREIGKTNRTIINRIEKNSPSDNADLKSGDEIVSINLKRIDDLKFDEIVAIFKAQSGRLVVMEVSRANKYLIKVLKLKPRI